MLEVASIKKKRVQFHKYLTSFCGLRRKILSEQFLKRKIHGKDLMERLEGAHEKFPDRITSIQTSRQPYVVNYVVDALMEDDEAEDAVALTEEQKGFLFLLLKTVIDVLDQRDMKS
jgi:hypothetical protein